MGRWERVLSWKSRIIDHFLLGQNSRQIALSKSPLYLRSFENEAIPNALDKAQELNFANRKHWDQIVEFCKATRPPRGPPAC